MDNIQEEVVNEEVTPLSSEEVSDNGEPDTDLPGSKTDKALLLKSLQEERQKRRELEEKLNQDSSPALSEEYQSDEAKALGKELAGLRRELSALQSDSLKREVISSNPLLKDHWDKFEAFRSDPDNAGMGLKAAARLFLVEEGLTETKPRKGLEKSTGGSRQVPSAAMTADDVKTLRETNPRRYREELQKGTIKV